MISRWRKKRPRPHDDLLTTIDSSCIYLVRHLWNAVFCIFIKTLSIFVSRRHHPRCLLSCLLDRRFLLGLLLLASYLASALTQSSTLGKLLTAPNRSLHLLKHSFLVFHLVDRWAPPIMSIIRGQQTSRSRSLAHTRMCRYGQ
jgi:hypothetical protein